VTTTFLLVRHAAHDRVGAVLCGRMQGVRLSEDGRAQAQRLAERFAADPIASVQAMETAEPIAVRLGQAVERSDALLEIDFGAWTGTSFEELDQDPRWAAWNRARAVNRPPYGETMLEAQGRIVAAMETLRGLHRERRVVLVSHSDVIKAALLYHLGLPLDAYGRIEIDPASISTLVVGDWGAKLIRLNEVVAA
jgi:broad specificity phosphatase PhoE